MHSTSQPTGYVVVLLALCTMLLSGCATLPEGSEPPYLSIVSIQPLEVTPLEQTYRLRVRVQNPNNHDLDITGMSYVLELNGHSFLKGVSDAGVTVPRYGEAVIELSGVSTLFGFVRQIQALQEQQRPNLSYRLTGKLSIAGRIGSLPFSYEGDLSRSAAAVDGI